MSATAKLLVAARMLHDPRPSWLAPGVALLLAIAPALAQRGPARPAAELRVLEPLVGHFEGTGTLRWIEQKTVAWTARSHGEWILDGFFLRVRTVVETGSFPTLEWLTILGRDPRRGGILAFTVGNDGSLAGPGEVLQPTPNDLGPPTPLDAIRGGPPQLDDLLYAAIQHGPDRTAMVRLGWTFEQDGNALRLEWFDAASMRRLTAEGRFHEVTADAVTAAAVAPFRPVDPAMPRLRAWCGEFIGNGGVIPTGPGYQAVEIDERARFVLGGHALQVEVGDAQDAAAGLRRLDVLAWDAVRGCYRQVSFHAQGGVRTLDARWTADGALLSTGGDGHTLIRELRTFDDGRLRTARSDAIDGVRGDRVAQPMTYSERQGR